MRRQRLQQHTSRPIQPVTPHQHDPTQHIPIPIQQRHLRQPRRPLPRIRRRLDRQHHPTPSDHRLATQLLERAYADTARRGSGATDNRGRPSGSASADSATAGLEWTRNRSRIRSSTVAPSFASICRISAANAADGSAKNTSSSSAQRRNALQSVSTNWEACGDRRHTSNQSRVAADHRPPPGRRPSVGASFTGSRPSSVNSNWRRAPPSCGCAFNGRPRISPRLQLMQPENPTRRGILGWGGSRDFRGPPYRGLVARLRLRGSGGRR